MSYYQKYRPRKIDELDLNSVRESLLSSLSSGRLSHAYLFVGPRGSGKTSTARIMAQVVNCKENLEKKKGLGEPCGKCDPCLSIANGSAVDVVEMDAASHRSIDDIRDLREKIRLSPVALAKKIYIIDEVHMLTNEAFNALLKTLEEPPEHAMFFLCTTESHKIPETIMSRCSLITFTKGKKSEVLRSLNKAVDGEGLKIVPEALEMVAEATDGSFREGHKILEQLASKSDQISLEATKEFLGMAKGQAVSRLIELAIAGRPKEVVELIDEMERSGVKAQIVVGGLLKEVKMRMEEVMGDGGFGKYARLADKLITAAEKIKYSPLPMLPVELALLSIAVEEERSGKSRESVREEKAMEQKEDRVRSSEVGESISQVYEGPLANIEKVKNEWLDFLSDLAPRNHSIAGLLRSAAPLAVTGRDLTLEVFYPFHKDQLEQDTKRKIIEEAVARVWGKMNVRCVLGKKEGKATEQVESVEMVGGKEDKLKSTGSVEEIFGV